MMRKFKNELFYCYFHAKKSQFTKLKYSKLAFLGVYI